MSLVSAIVALCGAADTSPAVTRLQDVQGELVALVDLLDPHRARFPRFRTAFRSTGGAAAAPPSQPAG